ncbi:peptidase S1 [Oceanobacillus iheyensis]|nr:peptidase S1 [Oceanobacillus iheyensis]AVR00748.1 peptidase S1 [Oceanobacillus iheyensis]NAP00776.1 trypsin-like serine protease [Halomonas sp. MG34]
MESENRSDQIEHKKQRRWKKPFIHLLKPLSAGVIGSVLTLSLSTHLDITQTQTENATEEVASATSETVSNIEVDTVSATSTSITDVIEETSEAVVGIVNLQTQQQSNMFSRQSTEESVESGTGSGVVYEVTENAAYIITNNHVIEDAHELEVSLYDGQTVSGELIGTDALTDLAIVKISGDFDIEPVKLGDSSALRSGDQVYAIGNPLGLDLSGTVTQGIVSAVNRSIEVSTSAGEWEIEVIQTDAAINPGNSGGALINANGELVGINSLKVSEDGVEGLGFAIPVNQVTTIVDELTANGEVVRPYVGVGLASLDEVSPYYLQSLPEGITEGVIIGSLDENSAAASAGLEKADIITALNGTVITDPSAFRNYLYTEVTVGDKLTITYYHDGEQRTAEITLTSNQTTNE